MCKTLPKGVTLHEYQAAPQPTVAFVFVEPISHFRGLCDSVRAFHDAIIICEAIFAKHFAADGHQADLRREVCHFHHHHFTSCNNFFTAETTASLSRYKGFCNLLCIISNVDLLWPCTSLCVWLWCHL